MAVARTFWGLEASGKLQVKTAGFSVACSKPLFQCVDGDRGLLLNLDCANATEQS